jgi:hypothetical protein
MNQGLETAVHMALIHEVLCSAVHSRIVGLSVLATLVIRPELCGKAVGNRSIVLLYSFLREQHDKQDSSLASGSHQTLNKTSHFYFDIRAPFRYFSQSPGTDGRERYVAPTIDRSESTDQTTSTH